MKKSVLTTEAEDVFNLFTDPTKKLTDFNIINEKTMLLEYELGQDFQKLDRKTNIVISSFCTSYARLKLWKVLCQLDQRVLYHDTDSVIFSYKKNEFVPETGEFLGDLTNELQCKDIGCDGCEEGHWIEDFVSCGPKNYSYRLNSGECFCKVRGFSLNYASTDIINFVSMKEALVSWKNRDEKVEMTTVKVMFKRNKKQPKIFTIKVPKNYGVVYNKRHVLNNFSTLPYGY